MALQAGFTLRQARRTKLMRVMGKAASGSQRALSERRSACRTSCRWVDRRSVPMQDSV